jgi:hypothetical protein
MQKHKSIDLNMKQESVIPSQKIFDGVPSPLINSAGLEEIKKSVIQRPCKIQY